MTISAYIASLSLLKLAKNLPGGIAQGLIWGLMALGVLITFRLLDVADLTVDGSFTLGAAVTVMLIIAGWPAWLAMLVAVSPVYSRGSARVCCMSSSASPLSLPVS